MIMWKLSIVAFCLAALVPLSEQVKKKELSLEDRWQQMSDLSHRSPVISLDTKLFRSLVRDAPRNYSTIVMLTALDERWGCDICQEAHDEYLIVANSHRYSKSYPNGVFFTMVDVDKGPDVFQSLNMNWAPVFIHVRAKGSYRKFDAMNTNGMDISAEMIGKWVATMTDVQIRVYRPPNYARMAGLLLLTALSGVLLYLLYLVSKNLELLLNKSLWAVMVLLFSFSMTSGQMWNHIRGPPFMHRGRDGSVSYIAGGSQFQLVVETYIVIVLSALTVTGMIVMIEAASSKWGVKKRRIMSVAGLSLLALFFSVVLSVFRSKIGDYPYRFLIN